MARTTRALDREWHNEYAHSDAGAAALRRWALTEPALRGLNDLDAVLDARRNPERAGVILAALARHAPRDGLAARTLFQALLPGLVELGLRVFRRDRRAFESVVAFAWIRICEYPVTRNGSVAGNVLLDVRKDYLRARRDAAPVEEILMASPTATVSAPSAEDLVLEASIFQDLADAAACGVISHRALDVLVRTRTGVATLEEVAEDHDTNSRYAQCIRWRAERKLRDHLPSAA